MGSGIRDAMMAAGALPFLRFCAVGVLGTLVDVAVLYGTAPLLGWYGARVISFLIAVTATWVLNRRYTFSPTANRAGHFVGRQAVGRWGEYLRYLLSMLLGGSVNYAFYAGSLAWWPYSGAPLLGVALGSGAGLGFNYMTARYLVFQSR